jgi:YHS domain-containing protein
MNTSSPHPLPLRSDAPNLQGSDYLLRDKEQSHRLHEPESMISTIDPITGLDIEDLSGKPYIVDGNMVMYFASEETRQAYLDTPKSHTIHLQDNPWEDGEAEG